MHRLKHSTSVVGLAPPPLYRGAPVLLALALLATSGCASDGSSAAQPPAAPATSLAATRQPSAPVGAWWLATPPASPGLLQAIGTGLTREAAQRDAQWQIASSIITQVQGTIDAETTVTTHNGQEDATAFARHRLRQEVEGVHLTASDVVQAHFDGKAHHIWVQIEVAPLVTQARARLAAVLAKLDANDAAPVPADLRTRLQLAGEANALTRQARAAAFVLLALKQPVDTATLWPRLATAETHYRQLLGDAVFVVKGDPLSADLKEVVRRSLQAAGARVYLQSYTGPGEQVTLRFSSASKDTPGAAAHFSVNHSVELVVADAQAEWFRQRWTAPGAAATSRIDAIKVANINLLDKITAQETLAFLGW